MAESGSDAPVVSKPSPATVSDSPVTDPGSGGKPLECSDGLSGPMSKLDVKTSSALKKSSRYRSRSLSASSTDSYSSGMLNFRTQGKNTDLKDTMYF